MSVWGKYHVVLIIMSLQDNLKEHVQLFAALLSPQDRLGRPFYFREGRPRRANGDCVQSVHHFQGLFRFFLELSPWKYFASFHRFVLSVLLRVRLSLCCFCYSSQVCGWHVTTRTHLVLVPHFTGSFGVSLEFPGCWAHRDHHPQRGKFNFFPFQSYTSYYSGLRIQVLHWLR